MTISLPPRRSRVAIDCRYLGPRPSGIGEMVAALVHHLPRLAPDLDFTLLRHASGTGALSDAPNVREVAVRSPANGPITLLHLPLAVNLAGIDLFHAPANIMPGGLAMPVITTIHDVMWLTDPLWCNARAWGRVERPFYRHGIERALSRSAAIATVSAASRDAICAIRPDAAPRVVVTRSGVAPDFAPVARDDDVLRNCGLPEGRRFCLVVGQDAPYKNHEGALRALAKVIDGRPDLDLVVVRRRRSGGDGLARLAEVLGLGGRIHFLPAVDRGVLVQLYGAAEVLLHPSLAEGFGNPVAEAMASGCPVVTSNCSAMPEVAGGAAMLVDPHDPSAIAAALSRVLDDRALAAQLVARGLKRAAELNWSNFAAATLALYRKVLSGTVNAST